MRISLPLLVCMRVVSIPALFVHNSHRFSLLSTRVFSTFQPSPVLDLVRVRHIMSTKKAGNKHNKQQGPAANNNTQSKKQQKKLLQFQAATETQINIFNRYYIEQYGQERWESLMEALQKPVKYVAMLNQYADRDFAMKLLKVYEGETVPFLPEYFHDIYIHKQHVTDILPSSLQSTQHVQEKGLDEDEVTNATLWPTPGAASSLDSQGLCVYYPFDAASLLPVLLLDVQPHHRVIDLCSAPGGKALSILQRFASFYPNQEVLSACEDVLKTGDPTQSMQGPQESGKQSFDKGISTATTEKKKPFKQPLSSNEEDEDSNLSSTSIATLEHSLICNDVSPDRRIRLKNVIRRYLPRALSEQIDVFNGDATQRRFLAQFANHFDRILLDVPCSSERHLIYDFVNTPVHTAVTTMSSGNSLLTWAAGRNKANADRQVILLHNSLSLLAMNGKLVYSTCALNKHENDEVIEKVLKKLETQNIKITEGKAEGERFSLKVEQRSLRPPVDKMEYAGVKLPFGEATEYGWHILPDVSDGWGPIYLAVLQKIPYDATLNAFQQAKDAKKLKYVKKQQKVQRGGDDSSTDEEGNETDDNSNDR